MTAEPTAFVVDDNPGLRRSLWSLIEAERLPVETFASARDFLERYDDEQPGCIVLDVRCGARAGSTSWRSCADNR